MNAIVVTGGGTGGHLSIAKEIIDNLSKRGYSVIFMGSTKGADKEWFDGYENLSRSYFFDTTGVVDKKLFGKIISVYKIFKATIQALFLLHKHKVSKVISVGGFSAGAASFATILSLKHLYIHEQNSVMGRLNKICSIFAKEVYGSYNNATKKVSYLVSKRYFIDKSPNKKVKTIIFLGGSQGSKAINSFALKIANKLDDMGINIIHQTGKNSEKDIKQRYEDMGMSVDIFGFSTKLFDKLKTADIAVCRAGAGTVWELCAMGLPAIFVPYPYAASNHQYFNAKFLKDLNLCEIIDEQDLNIDKLMKFINTDISILSKKLTKLIDKNGTDDMIDDILKETR